MEIRNTVISRPFFNRRDMEVALPLSRTTFEILAPMVEEVLRSRDSNYDKIACRFACTVPGSNGDAYSETKVRVMYGGTSNIAIVKYFAANEACVFPEDIPRRRMYGEVLLIDLRSGVTIADMDVQAISNIRTALTATIGAEHTLKHMSIDQSEVKASVIGVGEVGKSVIYALSVMQPRPSEIILFRRNRDEIIQTIRGLDERVKDEIKITIASGIEEAITQADVIFDCIATNIPQPVIRMEHFSNKKNFVLVDISKQTIDHRLVPMIGFFVFDSIRLGRFLENNAKYGADIVEYRAGRLVAVELADLMSEPFSFYHIGNSSMVTIMGLPTVDAMIAEYAFRILTGANTPDEYFEASMRILREEK